MKDKPKKKHLLLDIYKIKQIAFEKRSTIRRLTREIGVSKSQVEKWLKEGLIKAYTNDIHPELTPTNKLQMIKYNLNALVLDRNTHQIRFSTMHHVVHIDEKWFYMARAMKRYYILPGEEGPHRSCKSKRFIPNVMFMHGCKNRPRRPPRR
ncbi:hypothetical protein ACS0TY_021368 [Phlomoides rotata]